MLAIAGERHRFVRGVAIRELFHWVKGSMSRPRGPSRSPAIEPGGWLRGRDEAHPGDREACLLPPRGIARVVEGIESRAPRSVQEITV